MAEQRTGDDVVIVGFRVSEDLRRKARHCALDHGITLQELLRRAVVKYLAEAGAESAEPEQT